MVGTSAVVHNLSISDISNRHRRLIPLIIGHNIPQLVSVIVYEFFSIIEWSKSRSVEFFPPHVYSVVMQLYCTGYILVFSHP